MSKTNESASDGETTVGGFFMEKSRKRVKTALVIFIIPVLALAGRLFYIQILCLSLIHI